MMMMTLMVVLELALVLAAGVDDVDWDDKNGDDVVCGRLRC